MNPSTSITCPDTSVCDTYYRDLCENMGVALITTDDHLRIRVWNLAAGRMFGAAAERMMDTDVLLVFPSDRRECAARMLRRALDTGELGEMEFQHRDEYGQPREFAASVAPLVATGSRRIGASICIRDITRRIGLQNELLESRKLASLGELAGAIAHHFNNVLGGVVTSLDYAATASSQPEVVERILSQTSRAVLRAVALVNNLLTFSQKAPAADDLGDLTEVLNEVATETEGFLQETPIQFHFELDRVPVMAVPRGHLGTVLRNLIQNAIEAMPQGGGLTLRAELVDSMAVISVTDTGRGMDEIARGRLFEPFWTTKGIAAESPGTIVGLGLAIAHGLVHVMGGTIAVRSEVNKGSTFTVRIPVSPPV